MKKIKTSLGKYRFTAFIIKEIIVFSPTEIKFNKQ